MTNGEQDSQPHRAEPGQSRHKAHAVCRCGGCEKIFGRDDAREGYWDEDEDWVEYDEDRCPWCGTEVESDHTEVTDVEF